MRENCVSACIRWLITQGGPDVISLVNTAAIPKPRLDQERVFPKSWEKPGKKHPFYTLNKLLTELYIRHDVIVMIMLIVDAAATQNMTHTHCSDLTPRCEPASRRWDFTNTPTSHTFAFLELCAPETSFAWCHLSFQSSTVTVHCWLRVKRQPPCLLRFGYCVN